MLALGLPRLPSSLMLHGRSAQREPLGVLAECLGIDTTRWTVADNDTRVVLALAPIRIARAVPPSCDTRAACSWVRRVQVGLLLRSRSHFDCPLLLPRQLARGVALASVLASS